MRSLSAPTLAALAGKQVALVQLVRIDFPAGTVALNTSNMDLTWLGLTYKGANGLGTISAIEDSPGEIKGLQFTLSGVAATSVSLALDDADQVQGTAVTIRTALLDATTYQVVDAPIEWAGLLDTMTLSEDGETAAIQATAESSGVDLLHGSPLTYSDADQQSLVPGDRAFEFVVSQADQPIVWPAKEWFYK